MPSLLHSPSSHHLNKLSITTIETTIETTIDNPIQDPKENPAASTLELLSLLEEEANHKILQDLIKQFKKK